MAYDKFGGVAAISVSEKCTVDDKSDDIAILSTTLSPKLAGRLSKDKKQDLMSRLSGLPVIGPVMPPSKETFGFSSQMLKSLSITFPIVKDLHVSNVSWDASLKFRIITVVLLRYRRCIKIHDATLRCMLIH